MSRAVHLTRLRGRRLVAATAVVATSAALVAASHLTSAAAATPPPDPTNAQIQAAWNNKTQLASLVGTLSGQLAAAQSAVQQAVGVQELAEQKVAFANQKEQQAAQANTQAQQLKAQINSDYSAARLKFVRFIQASYVSGDVGSAGVLLNAPDPSSLLAQASLEQYQAEHQADAVGQLQTIAVERTNVTTRAAIALKNWKDSQAAAKQALANAQATALQAQANEQRQQTLITTTQAQLSTAQLQLATLNNQRATYVAYVKQQAAIAAAKAAARRLAQQRAAEAARRARLAREHQHHGGGGGGSSGGGGGGGSSSGGGNGPSAPSGGGWTAAKGRQAADRAENEIGVPYAWAGGGVGGPSYGVCDPSNGAPNDCNVIGFDCSGLVMYAWGQNWDHYAASQYYEAGSYHPSAGNFKPGDLLFWSSDGTESGIEHVAIYVGDGNVVQAPESGELITTTPWDEVMGGYYGATRPLT